MSAENPYTAPALVAENEKPESPALQRLATRSWQYPLAGFFVVLLCSFFGFIHPAVALAGVFFFLLSLLVGWVLSIIALVYARKYRRLFGPAITGFLVTGLLLAPIVVVTIFDLSRVVRQQ